MKIICNQSEFAALIRSCTYSLIENSSCSGCVFAEICSQECDMSDEDIMSRIEDICTIAEVDK